MKSEHMNVFDLSPCLIHYIHIHLCLICKDVYVSSCKYDDITYYNIHHVSLNVHFSGKARRGDGNDLTSNPRKLAQIGKELEQLSRVINDMTPVSEMPFGARCKSRKEKNKLASRACRLKKKAQHEANKVKCDGLLTEHRKF